MVDKRKTAKAIKQFMPKRTTIAQAGSEPLELPNYSGVKKFNDERDGVFDDSYLKLNGSNANTTIDIGSEKLTTTGEIRANSFEVVTTIQNNGGYDVIVIANTRFQLSHFTATPAYHESIVYSGVLKEGVNVKVFHNDGDILRIDLRKSATTGGSHRME